MKKECIANFRRGKIRERDLAVVNPDIEPVDWYFAGIAVVQDFRKNGIAKSMIKTIITTLADRKYMAFPFDIVAIAASSAGTKILEKCRSHWKHLGDLCQTGFIFTR